MSILEHEVNQRRRTALLDVLREHGEEGARWTVALHGVPEDPHGVAERLGAQAQPWALYVAGRLALQAVYEFAMGVCATACGRLLDGARRHAEVNRLMVEAAGFAEAAR